MVHCGAFISHYVAFSCLSSFWDYCSGDKKIKKWAFRAICQFNSKTIQKYSLPDLFIMFSCRFNAILELSQLLLEKLQKSRTFYFKKWCILKKWCIIRRYDDKVIIFFFETIVSSTVCVFKTVTEHCFSFIRFCFFSFPVNILSSFKCWLFS